MRKYLVFIGILLIALTGCTKVYKTDFAKKYSKYLTYSLGEYETNKRTIKWTSDPLPQANEGLEWTLKYKDVNGNSKEFEFRNYGYLADASDDAIFGCAVFRYASEICADEAGAKVCSKYYPYISEKDASKKDAKLPVTFIYVTRGPIKDDKKLFNPM